MFPKMAFTYHDTPMRLEEKIDRTKIHEQEFFKMD